MQSCRKYEDAIVQGGVKYLVHNDIYVTTVDGMTSAWNPDENTILFYDEERINGFW